MATLTREIAVSELKKWHEAKKISQSKLDSLKDCEEDLINAIMEGHLIVTEENTLKQILKFSIQETKELNFKLRLTINELNGMTKGLKPTDLDGKLMAYACAITGEPLGVIKALDTVDYSIVSCIVTYFL
jgi:hypothetical protein